MTNNSRAWSQICETYQIIGSEYKNRLLALVSSTDAESTALFSFATSKWPPELFTDLHVDTIYPIDAAFRVDTTPIPGSVSQFQFKIVSADGGHTMFYYYPYSTPMFKEFPAFKTDIDLASAKQRDRHAAMAGGGGGGGGKNFAWLSVYQREDLLAIDRSIADGSVTLTKRESKFREELEKREHEYIVFKDFRIYTATWNVNGQASNDICLNEWLAVSDEPPDIYAIAFQELDLSPKAITFNETRPDPVWV